MAFERLDERRADQPHEPGKAHQADVVRAQLGRERAIERVARRKLAVTDATRFEPRVPGAVEARRVGAVRNHDRDARIERPLLHRVDDRLEIAATP